MLKPLNDEKKKEIRIVGKVMDKGKMPLPGVTVVVKGTNLGTATDSEGKYRMVLPAMRDTNFVLVFSFVGMRTQEIKYVGQDSINVVMEEDHKKMDEVVVTGYSNIRKESFTGKATTVTKEQLMKVNSKNVIAALQTFDPHSGSKIINCGDRIQMLYRSLISGERLLSGRRKDWM